jgi:hypothetical protein
LSGNKKIKLYRDESGNLKGDGRCCYLKVASVPLALQVLDGTPLRGRTVSVTRVSACLCVWVYGMLVSFFVCMYVCVCGWVGGWVGGSLDLSVGVYSLP